MLDMIEKEKPGGLCFVCSKRHVKANDHYLPDYSPNEEENYSQYEDANNHFAWAIMQLPPIYGPEV